MAPKQHRTDRRKSHPGIRLIALLLLASSIGTEDDGSFRGIETKGIETEIAAIVTPATEGVPLPLLQPPADAELPGSLAMDGRQLDALIRTGTLEVLHPEGGVIQIELDRLVENDDMRVLHVRSAGLRGVITERSGNYFATIATPEGVYLVERRAGHTRITDQRQLDLKSNPHDRDYRHAPVA